jgi:hypothetical protein
MTKLIAAFHNFAKVRKKPVVLDLIMGRYVSSFIFLFRSVEAKFVISLNNFTVAYYKFLLILLCLPVLLNFCSWCPVFK